MDYAQLIRIKPHLFSRVEDAPISLILDDETTSDWVREKTKTLERTGLPSDWAKIGIVYSDPFILIIRDLVKFPSGKMNSYFRLINQADLSGGSSVAVLPIIGDKIVVLRQFRHPIRAWSLEIPRGFGEPATSAAENAHNELKEEIGGIIRELVDLGPYHSNTGLEGNQVQLYLAHLESFKEPNIEEGIESTRILSVEELERMIRNSEITDGFTIAAYSRAKLAGFI